MKKLFLIKFILLFNFGVIAQVSEFDLGIKAANSNEFENARAHFQKSLNYNLSNKQLALVHYNIGVCFYRLNQPDDALKHFEQAVYLQKNHAKAFYALGMSHADLQNWQEAEKSFQKAIKVSKNKNGEIWFDLAFVYINQKKYDEAFSCFQKAIIFGSQANGASHNNLGVIYAIKGDLLMANIEIEKAKKLGFAEAEENLTILRKLLSSNNNNEILSVNFKERINEQ